MALQDMLDRGAIGYASYLLDWGITGRRAIDELSDRFPGEQHNSLRALLDRTIAARRAASLFRSNRLDAEGAFRMLAPTYRMGPRFTYAMEIVYRNPDGTVDARTPIIYTDRLMSEHEICQEAMRRAAQGRRDTALTQLRQQVAEIQGRVECYTRYLERRVGAW